MCRGEEANLSLGYKEIISMKPTSTVIPFGGCGCAFCFCVKKYLGPQVEDGRGEKQAEERKQVGLKLVKNVQELTLEWHPL